MCSYFTGQYCILCTAANSPNHFQFNSIIIRRGHWCLSNRPLITQGWPPFSPFLWPPLFPLFNAKLLRLVYVRQQILLTEELGSLRFGKGCNGESKYIEKRKGIWGILQEEKGEEFLRQPINVSALEGVSKTFINVDNFVG
jgi:hypothetical protein